MTEDILTMLQIPQALVFHSKLNRSNLFYEVKEKSEDSTHLYNEIAETCLNNFKSQSGKYLLYRECLKKTKVKLLEKYCSLKFIKQIHT